MNIEGHWIALAVVAIIAAFAIAGNGDMEEAERAKTEYCENVSSGAWPDYRGNAAEVCK